MTPHLVLAGAGAAHLVVLRAMARGTTLPARVTLLAPAPVAAYSGMVPGVVAGRFSRGVASVDLTALAVAARAAFVRGSVTGVDAPGRRVLTEAGPLAYDWLALATGSAPALVPGAAERTLLLRPLDTFLNGWERLRAGPSPTRLLVVGGGAAAVEIALAVAEGDGRVKPGHDGVRQGGAAEAPHVTLICDRAAPLAPARAASAAAVRLLREVGVAVRTKATVERVEAGAAVLAGGEVVRFDAAIWATGSAPPAWLSASGLALSARGLLATDAALRTSDPRIFATGDVAEGAGGGAHAVRQGTALLRNLQRALRDETLRPHRPPRATLSLLLAGDRALALYGDRSLGVSRAALWLKDRIDRRWVASLRAP